jgi:amino acid transporter
MGRDGLMDARLSAIHERFDTPHRSILLTGGLILVFIVVGEVNSLARAGSVLHLLVYGLLNVSLIVFRETRAGGYDPDFEVPFYPAVPALGAVLSFALIGFMELPEVLLAAGLVVGGIVWYVLYVHRRVVDTSALAMYRGAVPLEIEVEVEFDFDGPAKRAGEVAEDG